MFSATLWGGCFYAYDALGRIICEKDLAKNVKLCYTYDELSRVTRKVTQSLITCETSEEIYNYDASGNISNATVNSGTDAFEYDFNNRLSKCNGEAVKYDLDGNMTSVMIDCEPKTFIYDSANRLVSTGDHTYTYDVEDVRIRNICSDSDTTYVYDTNCELSQLLCKTTNGITTKYVYGIGLIGEEKCSEFKVYHFDCRGSTVAITDIYGNITDTFEYDAYGKLSWD